MIKYTYHTQLSAYLYCRVAEAQPHKHSLPKMEKRQRPSLTWCMGHTRLGLFFLTLRLYSVHFLDLKCPFLFFFLYPHLKNSLPLTSSTYPTLITINLIDLHLLRTPLCHMFFKYSWNALLGEQDVEAQGEIREASQSDDVWPWGPGNDSGISLEW